MSGLVPRNAPLFPLGDDLTAQGYEAMPWMIGSRGLPTEKNYSRRVYKPPED